MIDFHKRFNADATIAVIDVPIEEASRFGIMSADENGRIFKFEEKPKNPDSTKASMGIYVFSKDVLFKYLNADAADENSANDFGKNIIPAMLSNGEKMMAYPFSGYWKDVGTIASLWEANMDLLGDKPEFSVGGEEWRIYSRHSAHAPQFVGENAIIENSSITEGCQIYGTVRNSVLGAGVRVMEGAVVEDAVIMEDVTVGESAHVRYSIIDERVCIGKNCNVGKDKNVAKGITVIAAGLEVYDNTDIADDMMISVQADIKAKEEA